MGRVRRKVKQKTEERLPDWLNEGASMLTWLSAHDRLKSIEPSVRIHRQGGYCGLDVFIVLVLYYSLAKRSALRGFCERIRPYRKQLAALVGRETLPSSASVSRALKSAEASLSRASALPLLMNGVEAKRFLEWPECQLRDTHGVGYHVFDFDHICEGVYRRALPIGEDLPQGKRRSDGYAAPGYLGRKRGDVKRTRSSLQHAGSSLWLGGHVSEGNGTVRADFEAAVETIAQWCEAHPWPRSRVILRGDGAFGSVPYLTACVRAAIGLVSRCVRPELFSQHRIVERLQEADWFFVPSSCTAPQRFAAEVGTITLTPSDKTRRADGSRYDPVPCRVVCAKTKRREGATEAHRGQLIDGWQYELFVSVGIEEAAFPAAEVVSLYYQRTGQENRFAQQDREVELDRLLSHHPAGQEFAQLAGQFVWNMRVIRGAEQTSLPDAEPPWLPRQIRAMSEVEPKGSASLVEAEHVTASKEGNVEPAVHAEQAETSVDTDQDYYERQAQHETAFEQCLRQIDWDARLGRHPGWHFDGQTLICPANHPMVLRGARIDKGVHALVEFCASESTCPSCPRQAQCMASIADKPVKRIKIGADIEIVEEVRQLSKERRKLRAEARAHEKRSRPIASGSIDGTTSESRLPGSKRPAPLNFVAAENDSEAGAYHVHYPLFLPAEARKLWRRSVETVEFSVHVLLPPPIQKRSVLMAADDADRQHRRQTWQKRLLYNQLPHDTHVHITIHTPSGVSPPWLQKQPTAQAA